jgi:hypothetical protein
MASETATESPDSKVDSPDSVADTIGLHSFASRPVLRLLDDGRLAPFVEILLYGSKDSLLFQRQLSIYEVTSVAEGLISAAARMLRNCGEHLQPKSGWALSTTAIDADIADIRKSLDALQDQMRNMQRPV